MTAIVSRITLRGIVLGALLCSCSTGGNVYRAYLGDPLSPLSVATIEGTTFFRQDMINRYVDSVHFQSVDNMPVENSAAYDTIQVPPGFHEYRVYFHWDMGNERGLAPALVSYATNRETMSRSLRFNARAGETYRVRAQPYFSDTPRDITTLTHVDFWVEDSRGNEVVSREDGKYVAPSEQ